MLQADDWMYPTCLSEMVRVAEETPSVGVVSAYTLLDWGTRGSVYLTGLPYSCTVASGRDACRAFLLEGTNLFGSMTSTLFRSEIVRSRERFYDEGSIVPDADACFRDLQDRDFGFVHQVLTYHRRYNDSVMSALSKLHYWELLSLVLLEQYGRVYLDDGERRKRLRLLTKNYRRAIGESMIRRRARPMWDFHRKGLATIGKDLSWLFLGRCLTSAVADLAFNPKQTLERLAGYTPSKVAPSFEVLKTYYEMPKKEQATRR